MDWVDHPASRVAITLLAAVMMTVLCTSPIRRMFRFVMEPKLEWFFRRDAGEQARARENGSAAATRAQGKQGRHASAGQPGGAAAPERTAAGSGAYRRSGSAPYESASYESGSRGGGSGSGGKHAG
jgi:hypothetical protein